MWKASVAIGGWEDRCTWGILLLGNPLQNNYFGAIQGTAGDDYKKAALRDDAPGNGCEPKGRGE